MSMKHVLVPAVAGLLLIVGCDKKKETAVKDPMKNIPATAPAPIKEPHEVLNHLRYIGVRQDMKHVSTLMPADEGIITGMASWFHTHSGDTGIALTEEEIKTFGVDAAKTKGYLAPIARFEAQKKLDEIAATAPAAPVKKGKDAASTLPAELQGIDTKILDFPSTMEANLVKEATPFVKANAKALYEAGLWRLTKGIPTEMWNELTMMETRKDPSNDKLHQVYVGFQGKTVMQINVIQRPDNTYGIAYWYFKMQPRTLAKWMDKIKAAEAAGPEAK